MIETSSDLLRSSSAIFGNLRKMFGSVRLAFGTILENLRKSSEKRHSFVVFNSSSTQLNIELNIRR